MTTISNLLRASADRAAPVLAAIRDEQLGAPTPCAEYRVGDLINHLFQVVDNFEGLDVGPGPDGEVRLYVLSDDNDCQKSDHRHGTSPQRTLLLTFSLAD